MIIAFIGEEKCCISNMIAFALTMYSESNKSILLADIGFGRTNLDEAFDNEDNVFVKEEAYYGIREGMDYLLYRMESGLFNKNVVKEGVTYVTSDFAYVKCALRGPADRYEKMLSVHFDRLSKGFLEVFDVVIIKCKSTADIFSSTIIRCCDVCVACFSHESIMKNRSRIYDMCSSNSTYIMIGNVIGNCYEEKEHIAHMCRIDERKISLVPYNSYFDMKLTTGGLLNLFLMKNTKKASFDEFYKQMKSILYNFRKWLEDMIYYE